MATAAGSFSTAKSNRRSRRGAEHTTLVSGTLSAMELICNVCFMVIVFVVPLMMAGVRETGVAVFVGCSLLMGTAWAISQLVAPESDSPFTFAVVLAFLAILLVGLQLVPLPQWALYRLSPFANEFFPAWNGSQSLLKGAEYWPTISLAPSLTRSGFVLLIAYVVFFLTLLQRIKSRECIDRILRFAAIAAFVMAVVGIVQLLTGSEQFLGMFLHPFRTAAWPAKGTFTNQNHFAHYLALGIGPLVWCWYQAAPVRDEVIRGKVSNSGFGQSRSKAANYQQYVGGAIAIVALAGVLSFSRGGIMSMLIAFAIVFISLGRQWTSWLKLGLPIAAFIVAGVTIFGTEILESKWSRLTGASSLEELCRGRFLLWSALLKATPYFWPLGAGVGSHAEVYPTWMSVDIGKRLSHAESGYFQILIESGVTGLLLTLAAITLCAVWFVSAWKSSDDSDRLRLVAVSAGLVVSSLHSLMDFAWYIPACLIFALILAACLCRLCQLKSITPQVKQRSPASVWPTCWAIILVVLIVPVSQLSANQVIRDSQTEPVWLAYREQSIAAGKGQSYDSMKALSQRLDDIIDHLEKCVQIDSLNYRAKTALATMYLHRFECNQAVASNPMTTQEIKQTVYAAEFESPKEIFNWLKKAFGRNSVDLYRSFTLARNAVHGQPLRAENYLVLAQLGFLAGGTAEESDALIEQAVRLRPFEPSVLYLAGLKEAEKNNISGACEQWKQAFHLTREIRSTIIRSLAANLSPEEIIQRIDPDADGLWSMVQHYRLKNQPEPRLFVANWYANHFSDLSEQADFESSDFWVRSFEIFQFVGDQKKAVHCLAQAVAKAPDQYELRKKCALEYLAVGATKAAQKEFEWCQLRDPDDKEIADGLATIALSSHREVFHEPE